jgi:predicted patatin/cPLA2 family phospholipase
VPVEPAAPPRRPQNILVLSGGGSHGAFTAGVLNGWTRTNHRPDFDVVTGVSTGALIAPIAFLGSEYDFELRKFYTEVWQRDIFTIRSWYTIPFRDAVATSAPLRRTVESGLTQEIVDRIAVEHKKGRRLYIATTRLDSRKTVVWDIGAIACRGGNARELILDLMIASCSIPGVLPPIPIRVLVDGEERVELHVDGGVTTNAFVPAEVIEAAARPAAGQPPVTLYVIVAGKMFAESARVNRWLFGVVEASGSALLSAGTRRDVANLYHMSRLAGCEFCMVALRQDFPVEDNGAGLDFDPNSMAPLFVEGVKVGFAGPVWQSTPVERGPGEVGEIRTGLHLRKSP